MSGEGQTTQRRTSSSTLPGTVSASQCGPHLGRREGQLDVIAAPCAGLRRAAAQRAHAVPAEALLLLLDPVSFPSSLAATQQRWGRCAAEPLRAAETPDRPRRRGSRATIARCRRCRSQRRSSLQRAEPSNREGDASSRAKGPDEAAMQNVKRRCSDRLCETSATGQAGSRADGPRLACSRCLMHPAAMDASTHALGSRRRVPSQCADG